MERMDVVSLGGVCVCVDDCPGAGGWPSSDFM